MQSMKALVDAHLIRTTAANVRGRLEAMLVDAEAATEAGTPGLVPSQLHPLIWAAAADHWTTHQYRVAVREAGETLTSHWRGLLGRADVDGTKFWESRSEEHTSELQSLMRLSYAVVCLKKKK